MNLSQLSEDEKQVLRRLADLAEISTTRYLPRFSSFLNERQALIACQYISQSNRENALLYGGYPGAVRVVCGFFPPYGEVEEEQFPIQAITLRFRGERTLTHRDFLGSLMGLGIKRESIGDILVDKGVCTIFALEPVAGFILQELKKVGSTGVACSEGFRPEQIPVQAFDELAGTVGSPRMDSLVKLITGFAREKSATLIRSGLVELNYAPCTGVSDAFAPGDTVTIRKHGKYIVDEIGHPTRKGRLPVRLRKYR